MFHGNHDSRELIYEHEFLYTNPATGKPLRTDDRGAAVYKFNVLITTWEVVMNDQDLKKNGSSHSGSRHGCLGDIPWDVVVIDEAHRLKNKESKTFTSLQVPVSEPLLTYADVC